MVGGTLAEVRNQDGGRQGGFLCDQGGVWVCWVVLVVLLGGGGVAGRSRGYWLKKLLLRGNPASFLVVGDVVMIVRVFFGAVLDRGAFFLRRELRRLPRRSRVWGAGYV